MDDKTCPKCGSQNGPSSTFCGQCGTSLQPAAQGAPLSIPPIPGGPPALPAAPPTLPQQPPAFGPATVTVSRTSNFSGAARHYNIFLDNVEIMSLKNGETHTVQVQPGNHFIYAKMDPSLTLTIQFTVAASENKVFSVHPSPPLPTGEILLKGALLATLTADPGKVITLEMIK
jgi:hypothetical protein